MIDFEMAHADDAEGIIKATQKAVLTSLQNVVNDLKNDSTSPGLTWEQIDFIIEEFKKKEPTIFKQEEEI